MYEIDSLVAQIDGMNLESKLKPFGNGSYTLKSDASKGQLRKVIVNDSRNKKSNNYYFHNDQLIFTDAPNGMYYFRDEDFTALTSNWRDENDLGLLKREKQIATAYRFLIMHKKSKGTKSNNDL
jgi:uncharacterized protein YukJ